MLGLHLRTLLSLHSSYGSHPVYYFCRTDHREGEVLSFTTPFKEVKYICVFIYIGE